MPEPELLTERLRMRPLRDEDLDRLYELYSDPRVEPWIGHHSHADVAVELSFHVAHWARFGWGFWAVEELGSGRVIGDCGLQPFARVGPDVELGYELDPGAWGRGLGTEVAGAALRYGFEELHMERVVAVTKHANERSQRVLEKVGLERAGEREAYGEQLLLFEATAPSAGG
jgi:ribosomal-protein-alanine N-acetyltransferase